MLGTPSMAGPLRGLVQRLQDWPVASQQQARRNAMVAATACAQRRAEREDVADYLAALPVRDPAAAPLPDAAPGVHRG
ncbi:hypothetical protein [Nocardioides litoris]|uniref:hypothetical protein n=1 Tax=Nocardioides litoris TaxID=1926648 RepID=UPI001122833C|nr:hypothetical protein [Nocardioides litoris]